MSELGDEDQIGSYSIYFAEGETLAKQRQFLKAIESFSKALEFQPDNGPCLVERSKCYLQLGDTNAALVDAEASLKENKKYYRGLYQKAETMYAMGDFEYALVFYHRGDKIRPDIKAFKLGIIKAQEAINNSIGSPAACKLDKTGDLSFFKQQSIIGKKRAKKKAKEAAAQQKVVGERKPVASDRTVKDILGELYVDREYLSNLLKDPGLVLGQGDRSIYSTIDDTLGYLDARTEFWRQQKPMYARKREKELKKYRPVPTKPTSMRRLTGAGADPTKYVLKSLEEIDTALASGGAQVGLSRAQKLMKTVQDLTEKDLPNKVELIASVHSCIGNALLEMGEVDKALQCYLEDLKMAEKNDLSDAKSRALDNLGRTYSVLGQYQKATEYWQQKLPLVTTAEEKAWLYHELGRCHYELENYIDARSLGDQSLTAAGEARDNMWQMNASVLIAQAETKLGNLTSALQSFERSLDLARLMDDKTAEEAIAKAIEDVNLHIVEELKTNEKEVPGNKDLEPILEDVPSN